MLLLLASRNSINSCLVAGILADCCCRPGLVNLAYHDFHELHFSQLASLSLQANRCRRVHRGQEGCLKAPWNTVRNTITCSLLPCVRLSVQNYMKTCTIQNFPLDSTYGNKVNSHHLCVYNCFSFIPYTSYTL